jgi:hypothetical protein
MNQSLHLTHGVSITGVGVGVTTTGVGIGAGAGAGTGAGVTFLGSWLFLRSWFLFGAPFLPPS